VHPYTPILLYLCCDFLGSNNHLDPTFELQLALQNVLRRLGHGNQIAQDCLNYLLNKKICHDFWCSAKNFVEVLS